MNWQCPYCGHYSTLSSADKSQFQAYLKPVIGVEHPQIKGFQYVCPNPKCKCMTLNVLLHESNVDYRGDYSTGAVIQRWALLPASSAKPQPEYIPEPIRQDYNEACAIRDLSPKASATLSRRCLQGMIRDFHGISKSRLIDEINALEDKLPSDVWEAIKAIKDVGNIGAHMSKDINVIVDVDADEAQMLISLIEQLFEDWYIVRHTRAQRMAGITAMAAEKNAEKKKPVKSEAAA